MQTSRTAEQTEKNQAAVARGRPGFFALIRLGRSVLCSAIRLRANDAEQTQKRLSMGFVRNSRLVSVCHCEEQRQVAFQLLGD